VALLVLSPALAGAQITLLPSSIVRVRADNHFGVTKDVLVNAPSGTFSSTITDTEVGTADTATNSANYQILINGATALFAVETVQSHSAGAVGNLTEGYLQFTTTEPLVYELSGRYGGERPDPGDGHQQRTFLRRFEPPFNTYYLEDEIRVAAFSALYVNAGDDTGRTAGSTHNQSGPLIGVLPPGTYEFSYELEGLDVDNDQAAPGEATGNVQLRLRRPQPPTSVNVVTAGNTVALSWTASTDVESYVLQAGSSSGAANLFAAPIGAGTALQAAVSAGQYFVRLFTANQGAAGPASEEVAFAIGSPACSGPPPAPSAHSAESGGGAVALRWGTSPGATSYVLDAGTASGAANVGSLNMGGRNSFTATVPGSYFTRVRAVNACGTSAPSAEAAFTTCVAPAQPALRFRRPAGSVRLEWTPSLGAAAYLLQVGTSLGASNIFTGSFGLATSLTIPSTILPPGVYFMRVIAASPCGNSVASPDVAVTLP
jgi:hypothetical protein